jgi:hypothetical protein
MPILEVIARLAFRVAKTMPHIPHEYTARTAENKADYFGAVSAIRADGRISPPTGSKIASRSAPSVS